MKVQNTDLRMPTGKSIASAALAGLLLALASIPGQAASLIDSTVIQQQFNSAPYRAKVIVNLVPPAKALDAVKWGDKDSMDTLHAANRQLQTTVITKLNINELRVRKQYDNFASFSGEVSEVGLNKLLGDPLVQSIQPIRTVELKTAQGIPLMNATAPRLTYRGAGVAVAIVDSGVDYTHPALGGGAFPNDKVIGGIDTVGNDADPRNTTSAHGTSVAGIVAGDETNVGDFIGGVAPDAKIYAVKVFADGGGGTTTDFIIAGWDNVLTNQNIDPNNPIMVVCNSLGGGMYGSVAACEADDPASVTAINSMVAAGMTVLVSSGNEGFCNAMAAPACISNAISVGATYDANLGTAGFCVSVDSCVTKVADAFCGDPSLEQLATDLTTAADQVTVYSNSASFLDILAPAHNASSPDIVGAGGVAGDYNTQFGGTSAACPYAAGVVALMQSAYKSANGTFLTPAEVRTFLTTTGDSLTDAKSGLATPRLNVANIIAVLPGLEEDEDTPTPTSTTPPVGSPTPTPTPVCKTYFPVSGDYIDPENDIIVDLYIETLDKFLAIAGNDPADATDPARIVADALTAQEYVANPVASPANQTLIMTEDIILPEGEGSFTDQLDCADLQLLVDNDLLLFGEPYIVLAVYTDLVPRPPQGGGDPFVMFYGTFSPGTYVFQPEDFFGVATPTPTGQFVPTPTPTAADLSLVVDTAVDPDTELPTDPELAEMELLDILWAAANFLPPATVSLYFDRDNQLEIRDMDGNFIRTVIANPTSHASITLSFGERIINNGIEGVDFGTIDLSVDPRFPPPPPTGEIDAIDFPNDTFRWDFSMVPAGRFFIYGILDNTNGQRVLDYAPCAVQAGRPRWPFTIGNAVDDRFVHGVAIHDIVASASELDVATVAQSGVFRVLDFLGRAWPQYAIDFNVTVDTAPIATDVDGDAEIEIILGTNRVRSDQNSIFAHQNAIISINAFFRFQFENLVEAIGNSKPTQAEIVDLVNQFGLTDRIHFLPPGQAAYHTPSMRDIDSDGRREAIVVTRSTSESVDPIVQVISFNESPGTAPVVDLTIPITLRSIALNSVPADAIIEINGLTFTAHANTTTFADREFSILGSNQSDAIELAKLINDPTVGVPRVLATAANGTVTLTLADPGSTAIVIETISPAFTTTNLDQLGDPAVGNVDDDPDFEIVFGTQGGVVYVLQAGPSEPRSISAILTIGGPALRSPVLVDVNGDGMEEILIALSERDRARAIRTELHFVTGSGQPVAPLTETLVFAPTLNYDSLGTPVVSRLFPLGGAPGGFTNPWVAFFTTRNAFVGINLTNGQEVFRFEPQGADQAFSSSSAVIGQLDPARASFEIVLGGGRDTRGNLFGWSFQPLNVSTGQLVVTPGFNTHNEPVVEGQAFPASILGSPELGDLDGNRRLDVIYTNEAGFINRFEMPEPSAFSGPLALGDFPWPSFKHDSFRTGSFSESVVPVQPFEDGDVNRDGVVDENDLFLLSKSWSSSNQITLRRGALESSPVADDGNKMTPQGYLIRVLNAIWSK